MYELDCEKRVGLPVAKKKSFDHLFEEDQPNKVESPDWLNSSSLSTRQLVVGDRFTGEVIAVQGQEAFLSTGTPIDAIMPFQASEKHPAPKVGELLDVVVVRARPNEVLVRPAGQLSVGVEADSLEDAYSMEIPVEGLVLEAIKGGFRVKVQAAKAFCPISQMDFRVTDPNEYVGKKMRFMITKYERGRDLVVSRRRLIEADRAGAEQEFLAKAEVGQIFSGKITRLEQYGAFIRLDNGMEGLVPVSEIAWNRIHHPQEVLNLDQVVQVKLLRMTQDEGRLKLSFSLKQGGSVEDPWADIDRQFPVGTVMSGRLERREPFGLFFALAQGVTGLMPKSSYRDSTDAKKWDSLKIGDESQVQVQSLDLAARRLSLAIPTAEGDRAWRDHVAKQPQAAGGLGAMAQAFASAKKK